MSRIYDRAGSIFDKSLYEDAPKVDLYNEDFVWRPGPEVCPSMIRYYVNGEALPFERVGGYAGGPLDAALSIHAIGEPGARQDEYHIFSHRTDSLTHEVVDEKIHYHVKPLAVLKFQTGPLREIGVDGITDVSLLAVMIHRLENLQVTEEYACEDNLEAKEHLVEAMKILQRRSRPRLERGLK